MTSFFVCVCVCVFVSPVAYFHYTTPNIDELYIYNNKININNNIVYPQYVINFLQWKRVMEE